MSCDLDGFKSSFLQIVWTYRYIWFSTQTPCGYIGFQNKIIARVLAWQSGVKVSKMSCRLSPLLKIIPQRKAGRFLSLLQTVMGVLRTSVQNMSHMQRWAVHKYVPQMWQFADLRFADHIFLRFVDIIIFCRLKTSSKYIIFILTNIGLKCFYSNLRSTVGIWDRFELRGVVRRLK